MPRTRAAETTRQRGGQAEDLVAVRGRHHPLSRAAVVRAALRVLRGERRHAVLSVTFVGRARMAALNAEWRGTPHPTDVLAFALPGPHTLAGDIYICPAIAAREARSYGVSPGRELLRLVVHGVLHVLGWDHPEGPERVASPMWRRQERYLRGLR